MALKKTDKESCASSESSKWFDEENEVMSDKVDATASQDKKPESKGGTGASSSNSTASRAGMTAAVIGSSACSSKAMSTDNVCVVNCDDGNGQLNLATQVFAVIGVCAVLVLLCTIIYIAYRCICRRRSVQELTPPPAHHVTTVKTRTVVRMPQQVFLSSGVASAYTLGHGTRDYHVFECCEYLKSLRQQSALTGMPGMSVLTSPLCKTCRRISMQVGQVDG